MYLDVYRKCRAEINKGQEINTRPWMVYFYSIVLLTELHGGPYIASRILQTFVVFPAVVLHIVIIIIIINK